MTIRETLDNVAKKHRWSDGFDISTIIEIGGITDLEYIINDAIKAYAEQESNPLRKALKEANEREFRLHKQIELKQLYTKDQVEKEREKAFKAAREDVNYSDYVLNKKYLSYSDYKKQNPLT